MPYISFTSTIQDIEVVVEGDYDPEDTSTGWASSFDVCKVFLPSDKVATNILPIIEDKVIERLENEGDIAGAEAQYEERQERKHAYSLKFQPQLTDRDE